MTLVLSLIPMYKNWSTVPESLSVALVTSGGVSLLSAARMRAVLDGSSFNVAAKELQLPTAAWAISRKVGVGVDGVMVWDCFVVIDR